MADEDRPYHTGAMISLHLPTQVRAVFEEFRTCEFSTLARDGTPITWPTLPFYQPASGSFLISTSIGLTFCNKTAVS